MIHVCGTTCATTLHILIYYIAFAKITFLNQFIVLWWFNDVLFLFNHGVLILCCTDGWLRGVFCLTMEGGCMYDDVFEWLMSKIKKNFGMRFLLTLTCQRS